MSNPLRYNISHWVQLAECKSNNSVDLHITVKQIIDDGSHRLAGTAILVNHTQYGTLFACLVNANGTILTPDENSGIIKEFTTDEITEILATFGFDVTFKINQHLDGDQISYLITLNDLGFDKLRKLYVYKDSNILVSGNNESIQRHYSEYLVAFNVEKCPDWIQNDYTCGEKVFLKALQDSGAMNLTDLKQTKGFDWTWLTYVANIEDIIEDNGVGED
ncbi:MAG: hypothetical protein J5725_06330 [Bacteroidales bacterium]|nr:hypothetical protein [Bacteroidales bacterium]